MTQSHQSKEQIITKSFIEKWRKDIVKFPPVIKINSKGKNILGHTAPFPEYIPEFAIRMFSYKGDIVLDPFAGSFTSSIVAKKLNRIGIGIEKNKELFRDSVIDRIEKKIKFFNEKSFEEYIF